MGGIDLELRMVMKKMTNFIFNKCKHIKQISWQVVSTINNLKQDLC